MSCRILLTVLVYHWLFTHLLIRHSSGNKTKHMPVIVDFTILQHVTKSLSYQQTVTQAKPRVVWILPSMQRKYHFYNAT